MALGDNQKHFQLSDLVTDSNHPYVVDLYTSYGGMTCQSMFKSTEKIGVTNPMSSLGQNIYMVLFLSLNFTKRIWNFYELILNIAKRVFFLKEHKSERKGKGIFIRYKITVTVYTVEFCF